MKIGDIQVTVIDIVTFSGMMITLFTSVLNLFQNRKSMYINNIIKCRLDSVEELKKSICSLKQLSNIINLKIMCRDEVDKVYFRRDLDKHISNIELCLNPGRKLDSKIIIYCRSIKKNINNYMYMYYLYEEVIIKEDEDIVKKFINVVYNINDSYFFYELINMYDDSYNFNDKKSDLLKTVNEIYNNKEIILEKLSAYDKIMQGYENNIEVISSELDYLIYLYVELKWIRCKKEMKMWPFNKFNENKEMERLLR